MKCFGSLAGFTAICLVLFSCGTPAVVTPAPQEKTPAAATASGWQQEWEKLLAQAKKESSVMLYTTLWSPDTRNALTRAVKDKYGINLDFVDLGRGAALLARVQAETRAGLYVPDIFGSGGPTLVTVMKPAGVLGPIEPLLVLPEVKDPKLWSDGKFPFLDKDKRAVGMVGSAQPYLFYNSDLIKKAELTNYRDVLKPQYRGKITMSDPTVTGTGNAFLSTLAVSIWNLEDTKQFLIQLINQQDLVIQRDGRLHVESVARGKYAIGLAPAVAELAEFLRLGAPIAVVDVQEGVFVSPAAGALAVPAKLANPAAAQVFINWLLSKDGQTVFSQSFGSPSLRTDAPTTGINPIFIPQPGQKVFLDSEETIIFRGQMVDIARQVIQEASR